jgi:hypothetical protein
MQNSQYKIEKYKLVQTSDSEQLGKKINSLLENGWQPYGFPYCIQSTAYYTHCQAVVKYETSYSPSTGAL